MIDIEKELNELRKPLQDLSQEITTVLFDDHAKGSIRKSCIRKNKRGNPIYIYRTFVTFVYNDKVYTNVLAYRSLNKAFAKLKESFDIRNNYMKEHGLVIT